MKCAQIWWALNWSATTVQKKRAADEVRQTQSSRQILNEDEPHKDLSSAEAEVVASAWMETGSRAHRQRGFAVVHGYGGVTTMT